jgi:5-methyltetrahydrofolate--homocysteine methyltransferase
VSDELSEALVSLDSKLMNKILLKLLSFQKNPMDILGSLRSGLEEVGRKFENGEYFVSELVMAGELMKKALDILKPHLVDDGGGEGKIVLGTIVGDLHDIGKDIVQSLLVATGFEVYDLGVDVSPEKFVEKAEQVGAKIIGVSALLSTSIANTTEIIKALKKAKIRDKVNVIVGGAAARPWMVEKYGVDAAVTDAINGK